MERNKIIGMVGFNVDERAHSDVRNDGGLGEKKEKKEGRKKTNELIFYQQKTRCTSRLASFGARCLFVNLLNRLR